VEWIGVVERAQWHHSGSGADHEHAVLARQRRTRQHKLAGEFNNLICAHLAPRFPMLAVAVKRDRTADWQEWPAALFVVLDPKLLIEQPPPDHDRLAGKFGINLGGHARDRQAAVDADQAPLGLAREDGCNQCRLLPEQRQQEEAVGIAVCVRHAAYIREHDMRFWLAAVLGALMPTLAAAQPATRPVVGELFTSEGCSSCPPADAKVAELARTRPDLLLLTFHVTYWNNLGWHDPYSFDAATERQRRYVALGASPEVYTPALIVDGKLDAVGSDAATVDHTLRQAALSQETAAPIDLQRGPTGLTVSVGAGTGNGTLLLIGYDRLHRTPVVRGENGGRTLEEANIVRSMSVLNTWSGKPVRLQVPYPAGQEVAVLLQRDDGHIVGAAVAHASSPAS
jgi:hypothetical protein